MQEHQRRRVAVGAIVTLMATLCVLTSAGSAVAETGQQGAQSQPTPHREKRAENNANDQHDTSPPLRNLASAPNVPRGEHPDQPLPAPTPAGPDPVAQTSAPAAAAPATSTNFDGVGNGFVGPAGTYTVGSAAQPLRAGRKHRARDLQQDGHRRLRAGEHQHAVERVRRELPDHQRRRCDRPLRRDGRPVVHHPVRQCPQHECPVLRVHRGVDIGRPDRHLQPVRTPTSPTIPRSACGPTPIT
jgi:hypothetical protein